MAASPMSAAHQRNEGHLVAMKADGLCCFFDGIGRVAVHAPPAIIARLLSGVNKITGRIEFGKQAVCSLAGRHINHQPSLSPWA